ncbi:MAG: aldo/keto reductase [Lentisphaeria bacterium]|nr:aldo/keto reductase [Lentisphaeria bacterium]
MYKASENRYDGQMTYRRCGRSGLLLPMVSLGLWHNFGGVDVYENSRSMLHYAFDHGITHFDLANNYGPPPGSAEENFGRIFSADFKAYRDELIISSKAGYLMWPGPYGEWGSRKNLIASCDQSLKRMQLDYVDIFYHHRPDESTPLEESMSALEHIVRSGRALYVGISSYSPERTLAAAKILRELGTPCLIHQFRYNIFNQDYAHNGLFDVLKSEGIGGIVFSPLAQGLLTNRYLKGIPEHSRASVNHFLKAQSITPELVAKISKLNDLAARRGETLAQMSLKWILRHETTTSVLVGASSCEQISDLIQAAGEISFTAAELNAIDEIVK